MNAPLPAKAFQARSISLASRYGGRTVLAIGAHPDDVELAIGGMLARLSRESARVVIAVVSIPTDFATRHAEAQRAAEILGCELRILVDDGC
jgi:LmbE family N-acetylglucosaminyl deacetylase